MVIGYCKCTTFTTTFVCFTPPPFSPPYPQHCYLDHTQAPRTADVTGTRAEVWRARHRVAMPSCAGIFAFAITTSARPMTTMPHEVPLPWGPPPPNSTELIPYLRNTSRPKLAFSTYIGWYEDGGLNETSLDDQVDAMATRLRSSISACSILMRSGRIPARCRYRPNDEGGKQCV